MSLSDNALLTNHSLGKTVQHGLIDKTATKLIAADVIKRFDVRVPSDDPIAASLSGGNLQKFVVGREIIKSPRLLVVAQPTWGVDVGGSCVNPQINAGACSKWFGRHYDLAGS